MLVDLPISFIAGRAAPLVLHLERGQRVEFIEAFEEEDVDLYLLTHPALPSFVASNSGTSQDHGGRRFERGGCD